MLDAGDGWFVSSQDISEQDIFECESHAWAWDYNVQNLFIPNLGGTKWSVLEKTIYVPSGQSTGLVSIPNSWDIEVTPGMEYSCLAHVEVSLSEPEELPPEEAAIEALILAEVTIDALDVASLKNKNRSLPNRL